MEIKVRYTPRDARKVLLLLVILELAFVLVYVVTQFLFADLPIGPIRNLFDLNRDLSIPAWFSSIQLFVIGCILFLASRINQREQYLPSSFLIAGSLFFLFLSIDEGAAVHEKITLVARKLELDWLMFNGNHGAWIVVYGCIGLVGGLIALRYFRVAWKHFRQETLIALCGITLFLVGAVGFEVAGYLLLQEGSSMHKVEVVFEEFFEMIGISIVLYATLLLVDSLSLSSAVAGAESLEGI